MIFRGRNHGQIVEENKRSGKYDRIQVRRNIIIRSIIEVLSRPAAANEITIELEPDRIQPRSFGVVIREGMSLNRTSKIDTAGITGETVAVKTVKRTTVGIVLILERYL